MWKPIEELLKMNREERLGYLSFTSDDMKEKIVSYLLDFQKEDQLLGVGIKEDLVQEIKFLRSRVSQQAEQIEKLKAKP